MTAQETNLIAQTLKDGWGPSSFVGGGDDRLIMTREKGEMTNRRQRLRRIPRLSPVKLAMGAWWASTV